jgi:hypothetical protein
VIFRVRATQFAASRQLHPRGKKDARKSGGDKPPLEILGELTVHPIGLGDVEWVDPEPPEDTQDDRASEI